MSRRQAERARSAAEAAQSAAAGAPGPTAAPRLPPGEPPLGGRLGGRLSELPGAAPAGPDFARERAALERGLWPVAGCDEAGRGPLAGPVVAAAVILDPDIIPPGLDDSKRLTAGRRAALYDLIVASAEIGVAFGPPSRIDRDNIREAALWALAQAVRALPTAPRLVLVDGRDLIAVEPGCDCEAIVKGDARVLSIAAASIVAKVTRDRLMARIGAAHPGYGFERHCGYGVPEHARALNQFGATIHHRRTFAPVAQACGARSPGAPDADR